MKDIFGTILLCLAVGMICFFEGKSRADAIHARAVAEAQAKAAETTQRLSQSLAVTSKSLAAKDAELANLTEQLNDQTDPDTCAVPARKLLRLDAIR